MLAAHATSPGDAVGRPEQWLPDWRAVLEHERGGGPTGTDDRAHVDPVVMAALKHQTIYPTVLQLAD